MQYLYEIYAFLHFCICTDSLKPSMPIHKIWVYMNAQSNFDFRPLASLDTSAYTCTLIGGICTYSKTCLKQPLSKRPKICFQTNYRLMQVKSIVECSMGSILQYFRPSLIYHLPLRSLFCLFLSGRLRQVLLYFVSTKISCLAQICVSLFACVQVSHPLGIVG